MITGVMPVPVDSGKEGGIIVVGLSDKDRAAQTKIGYLMRDFKLPATMITRSPHPDSWDILVINIETDEDIDTAIKRVFEQHGVNPERIESIEIHDRLHGDIERET